MATNKGFIKDYAGNILLPITRGELVLDSKGKIALFSEEFIATTDHPGLMTAAEKAMLSGTAGGQNLSDIYTKLGYINSGLQVNGSTLNFYNTDGEATPINITSADTNALTITTANNVITLGLKSIHTNTLTVSQIVKNIEVDKYGRVIAVSGAALTNDDLPSVLTNKTIVNGTLQGCTTSQEDIGTDTKAIVNKAYVDKKFEEVTGLATGALKFGGPLSTSTATASVLNANNLDSYFKVTGTFELSTSDLYDTSGTSGNTVKVKPGDTLIVTENAEGIIKFVYIPSADETVTTITVKGGADDVTALDSIAGKVVIEFSDIFAVENLTTGSNTANISIPKADGNTNGYLSAEDWTKFQGYATQLNTEYTEITDANSIISYEIGTLKVGTLSYTLHGKYNTSALTLTDGASDEYNPILKFTETGTNGGEVKITLEGVKGVKVRKSYDNNVEISAANEVDQSSSNYLKIEDGYKFKLVKGSYDGTTVTNGLTDYKEFHDFQTSVAIKFASLTQTISNSLNDDSATYYYGSADMISAIDFESYES